MAVRCAVSVRVSHSWIGASPGFRDVRQTVLIGILVGTATHIGKIASLPQIGQAIAVTISVEIRVGLPADGNGVNIHNNSTTLHSQPRRAIRQQARCGCEAARRHVVFDACPRIVKTEIVDQIARTISEALATEAVDIIDGLNRVLDPHFINQADEGVS